MGLRGDYITLKYEHSSGVTDTIVAESTSVNIDLSGEALETTSQASALNATFIAGKVSGTASGDFLYASDGTNFSNLFTYMNAGTVIDVRVDRNGAMFLDGQGVITSLSTTGALSDALATGAYSIQFSGDMS